MKSVYLIGVIEEMSVISMKFHLLFLVSGIRQRTALRRP